MRRVLNFILSFIFTSAALADVVVPAKDNTASMIVGLDSAHLSKQVSYKWGVDPFFKTPGFVKGALKEPSLELTGVLNSDDENSSAIINKQTVYKNSVIEGYAVREIGDNYVIVERGEHMRELQISPIKNKVDYEINPYDRLPAMESESSKVGK